MNGLTHLLEIRSVLERGLCIRINAVGALDSMRHGEGYQALFPCRERAFRENGAIPRGELLPKFGRVLSDVGKVRKVFLVVVAGHVLQFRKFDAAGEFSR